MATTPMERVYDAFDGRRRSTHWNRLERGAAWVQEKDGLKLIVEGAEAGNLSVAQIDDYIHLPRARYYWRPPLQLHTRLRASHPSGELLGTAGVGFWNNPMPLWGTRMEVNPNWIWFYYASPQSNISLAAGPTHGWKASVVHAGRGGGTLLALGERLMQLPGVGRWLSQARFPAQEAALDSIDFTHWHDLTIEWLSDRITFRADEQVVLQAELTLDVPLAFVAWLDNNYASLTPDGKFEVGNLAIPQRQAVELAFVEIDALSA